MHSDKSCFKNHHADKIVLSRCDRFPILVIRNVDDAAIRTQHVMLAELSGRKMFRKVSLVPTLPLLLANGHSNNFRNKRPKNI